MAVSAVVVLILNLASLVLLALVVYQDIKQRAVIWVLFPALCVLLLAKSFLFNTGEMVLQSYLSNILFIAFQIAIAWLYLVIRRGGTKLFDSAIGWGDICFWLVAAACFSFINFVLFFIASLILALLLHLLVASGIKARNYHATIPLAGYQAVGLFVFIVYTMFSSPDFGYSDDWVVNALSYGW